MEAVARSGWGMATVVAWRGDRAAEMRLVIVEIIDLLRNGMT